MTAQVSLEGPRVGIVNSQPEIPQESSTTQSVLPTIPLGLAVGRGRAATLPSWMMARELQASDGDQTNLMSNGIVENSSQQPRMEQPREEDERKQQPKPQTSRTKSSIDVLAAERERRLAKLQQQQQQPQPQPQPQQQPQPQPQPQQQQQKQELPQGHAHNRQVAARDQVSASVPTTI